MDYKNLILEKKEGIAEIILNRPEVLNAVDNQLLRELLSALEDVAIDDNVDVVILKGIGRAFCAGADLNSMFGSGGEGEHFSRVAEMIEVMDKPVIAAVHGFAITGGFLLAYSSDIVIAADDAVFADTHALWGLIPNGGESQRLPRLVGKMKAKELMFTSDQISASEAERIGLVNKVVPRDKLDEAAEELARKLLSNSRNSIAKIKSLINRGMEVDFATGLKLEGIVSKWGAVNREPNPDREARLKMFAKKTSSTTKR